jgi:hypothetical protein
LKNQFGVSEVNEVMKSRGITRKSAVRFLRRQHTIPTISSNLASAAVVKDVKMAQANDKTLPVFGPTPTKAKAPQPEVKLLTPEQRGAARKEGLRLHKLAGRPNKDQIVAAYSTPKAYGWTWAQRAKSVSLATAEEAALKFQSLLLKKAAL